MAAIPPKREILRGIHSRGRLRGKVCRARQECRFYGVYFKSMAKSTPEYTRTAQKVPEYGLCCFNSVQIVIVIILLTCPTLRYDVVVAGRGNQCATLDHWIKLENRVTAALHTVHRGEPPDSDNGTFMILNWTRANANFHFLILRTCYINGTSSRTSAT